MGYGSFRYSNFIRNTSFLSSFQDIEKFYIWNSIIFLTLFDIYLTRISCYSKELTSIGIVVCWDLMSPPELTGDTPVTEIVDPILECFIEPFWNDLEFSFFISSGYLLSHSARFHEPLSRYNRFDTTTTTRAESNTMGVWFDFYKISFAFQEFDNIAARFTHSRESCKYPCFCTHESSLIYDSIISSESMTTAHLKI